MPKDLSEASLLEGTCVLLADRHLGLLEGLRGLLGTVFTSVASVDDVGSLLEVGRRVRPDLLVVDVGLARTGSLSWLRDLRQLCPGSAVIVLGVDDRPLVRRAVIAAGAAAYVSKRAIGTDLMPAVDALLVRSRSAAGDEPQPTG